MIYYWSHEQNETTYGAQVFCQAAVGNAAPCSEVLVGDEAKSAFTSSNFYTSRLMSPRGSVRRCTHQLCSNAEAYEWSSEAAQRSLPLGYSQIRCIGDWILRDVIDGPGYIGLYIGLNTGLCIWLYHLFYIGLQDNIFNNILYIIFDYILNYISDYMLTYDNILAYILEYIMDYILEYLLAYERLSSLSLQEMLAQ